MSCLIVFLFPFDAEAWSGVNISWRRIPLLDRPVTHPSVYPSLFIGLSLHETVLRSRLCLAVADGRFIFPRRQGRKKRYKGG